MIDSLSSMSSTLSPTMSGAPSIATGAPIAGSDAPAAVAPGIALPTFGQTLGQFLDRRDLSADRAMLLPESDTGQKSALGGKDLPVDESVDTPVNATATAPWLAALATPLPTPMPGLPVMPPTTSDQSAQRGTSAGTSIGTSAQMQALVTDSTVLPPTDCAATVVTAPTDATQPTRPVAPDLAHLMPTLPDQAAAAVAAGSDKRAGSRAALATAPALATLSRPATSLLAGSTDGRITPAVQAGSLQVGALSLAPQPITKQTLDMAAPQPTLSATAPRGADQSAVVATNAQPTSAITVSTTPQPAGQVFAAALATATSWRDRTAGSLARDPAEDAAATITASPIALQERAVVHAVADAQGSALDLTKDSGLQRMIDRIETLRDGKDAGDTRIRLVPDALGSVDIAVRQEGDRVHVHFTAEQDTTRALLTQAQPRLTELAAARGVRIGETSVGGDTPGGTMAGGNLPGGNNAPPQPRPLPQLARAPRSAASDTATTDDQRLA